PYPPSVRRTAGLAVRTGPLRPRRRGALARGTVRCPACPLLPGGSDSRMTQKECRMRNAECRMQKLAFYSAFCILHSALFFVSPCVAQSPHAPGGLKQLGLAVHDWPPYGQRTDIFRRLLFESGFQPLSEFAQLQANPGKSILIVLGDPTCLSRH